jgi:peroxiredoxin
LKPKLFPFKKILIYWLALCLFIILANARGFPYKIYTNILYLLYFFILFLIVDKREKKEHQKSLLFASLILSTIIDSSVVITNPLLVPLRFPFGSIFPILGLLLGYIYQSQKRILGAYASFTLVFITLSHFSLIPRIIYYTESRIKINIDNSIFKYRFLSTQGDTVLLDNYRNNCVLVEYYFVGCGPCIKKQKILHELENKIDNKKFTTILICDGSITSYKKFIENLPQNSKSVILFDYNKVLDKFIPKETIGYPFEMIFDKYNNVHNAIGYTDDSKIIYLNDRINKIKKIINAN